MSEEVMEVEGTEAVEQPAQEAQDVKTFTQEEIDRIVADRIARQQRQFEKKLEGIDLDEARQLLSERQNAEIEKQKERGEFESILKQTVEKKDQEIGAYKAKLEQTLVDGSLLSAAAKNGAVSPEQVSQLLRGSVSLSEDGTVEVFDKNGTPRYNDKGELLTVEELVADFLTTNPHFVKASQGGAGSAGAVGGSTPKTLTAAEMLANYESGGREAFRELQLAKKATR
jgi:hypothetical protein